MSSTDLIAFGLVLAAEIDAAFPASKGAPIPRWRIAETAVALMRIARAMHRQNEHDCNYGSTPASEKADERRAKKARDLVAPYGIKVVLQGDPRGAAMRLVLPITKCSNGWGNDGYCVPEGGAR